MGRLRPEGAGGVDSRGAAGGDGAGQERDREQDQGDGGIGRRIGCADSVEECGGVFLTPAAAARHGMPPFAPRADPYGEAAERLKGIPVRLYHGADDDSVPVEESRLLAAALEARGANVKYVEYRGVGHGSWIPAFDDPELWRWLLARNRALTQAPKPR